MVALQWLLAAFVIAAGVAHFRTPAAFERMVPTWLPSPRALVIISGVFEILGGVGLLIPMTTVFSAWGLMALFLAVFPANVHMALHRIPLGDRVLPGWALWGRLPLQVVLIAWAWLFT